ncbi:MAG: P13 family porin [Candidatus Sericytochromatia bacterium]
MKSLKAVFLALLIAAVNLSAYAEPDTSPSPGPKHEIIYLLNKGLEPNFSLIEQKSQALSREERFEVYNQIEKEITLNETYALSYNLIIGLGVGSFIQGDVWGGAIAAAIELLSLGLVIGFANSDQRYWSLVGLAGFSAAKLGEAIRTRYFSQAKRDRLGQVLLITQDPDMPLSGSTNPWASSHLIVGQWQF